MRRTLVLPCVLIGAVFGLTDTVPASASVNVLYTIEADTPHVSIAYAPGQWQDYALAYSNLAGRYSLTVNTRPATRPAAMYIAAKGTGNLHCRIRVSGEVVVADNSLSVVVCRA